jgi:hypothetical protein
MSVADLMQVKGMPAARAYLERQPKAGEKHVRDHPIAADC